MPESGSGSLYLYSTGEEIANSITHGLGVLIGCAALALLVVFASIYGDAWQIVSFSIFGSTMILLYLASTLYHSVRSPRLKKLFKTLDHSAIYLLIAGTYTPLMIGSIRGGMGWTLFGIVWGLAAFGIVMKFLQIQKFRKVSTLVYVLMGWMCLMAARQLLENVPPVSLVFLVTGGLVYTFGVIFYTCKKIPFNHAIWHLFVLGGSVLHFFAILFSI
jgi:hemolysin III